MRHHQATVCPARHATNPSQRLVPGAGLSTIAGALCVLASLGSTSAQAFEIETGNEDLTVRWDNTPRYNYGVRMKSRDPALLANPGTDDGNRNFAKGQAVTNRLDLLTELDLVYKKSYGLRLSAVGWADAAYGSLATDASRAATYNGVGGPGTLSNYANRYAKGPSGEILDAFVFANFEAGETPVNLKLGRHTAVWGEALMLGGAIHGVSYGQNALDIWKANATPGAEAKELYRPRNGLTVQAQPTRELSIAAQTFFDWEAARLPEAGTYLSGADALLFGGERFFVPGMGFVPRGASVLPKKTGDGGLAIRWSPDWLDGTAGLYLRRTSDLAQQSWLANLGAGPQYHYSFARGINIIGTSLSKNIGGVSVGAEVSVRNNMPLVSNSAVQSATVSGVALQALADAGRVPGARGNTAHAVLNAVSILPRNPLFDSAVLAAEFTWNRVLSVTSDPFNLYKGTAAYAKGNTAGAANIDAVTRDASTLSVAFTPTWLGALPGVDLSMPMTYSTGLSGNSAVANGGYKNVGSWSLGVAADVQSKYTVSLRYIAAFGRYSTIPAGPLAGAAGVAVGPNSTISDRDMLVLTLKTTF